MQTSITGRKELSFADSASLQLPTVHALIMLQEEKREEEPKFKAFTGKPRSLRD